MSENFKATVTSSGMQTTNLYGKNYLMLRGNAKRLLVQSVGWQCYPTKVEMFKSEGRLSGNRSKWTLVESIPWASVKAEFDKNRETACAMNPF